MPEDATIVGYHATSASAAATILATGRIEPSTNAWDWLGHGIYFWENAPGRAWQWAVEKHPEEPAVVIASIRLGACLDLTDNRFTSAVQVAYHRLRTAFAEAKQTLPSNRGKARYLDCLVINYVCSEILKNIETVRATFPEGEPLYTGSAFHHQSHIQVCVRTPANIVKMALHDRGSYG
jgi:hypothetical protein